MRVALYARYSTDLQSAASAEDQLRACRTLAAREGWTVAAEFADEALSGTSRDRPGLIALLARAAEFDLVVTESLDRLSRVLEDIANIYTRLRFARCAIHTLSEGRVSEVHIGMRGTMSAMLIKDIGDKTRRGQTGRAVAGRIPGGLSYGYRRRLVVDARGEPERGLRDVDEAEAVIVREIFAAYAAGDNARTIATRLNGRGVPAPAGRQWNASTINGSRQAANGILQNPLYAGELIYNRRRFERDPLTRKRVSRPNAESDWTRVDVPGLRIVDQALWDAVAARREIVAKGPAHIQRRPRRLLSGLIRCGVCGGSVTVIGTESWGCATRRESGTCTNNRTVMTKPLERRVIAALREQLLHPDCVTAYVAEYRAATAEIAARRRQDRDGLQARHDMADARVKRLAGAIADGADVADIRDLLHAAVAARDGAASELATVPTDEIVRLHPGAADKFRRQIDELADVLYRPAPDTERLRDLLRACVARIVATPAEDRGFALTIEASLDPILTQKRPRRDAEADPMLLVVAGTGFEPVTFRL